MKPRYSCHNRPTVLLFLLVVAGCGEPAADTPASGAAELTSGRAVTLGDIQDVGVGSPAMPLPNLLTAAQPTEEQFAALVDMGYSNFISLRPPTESGAGWEESLVLDEGVSFSRIPVAGAAGLTRENVEALDRILDEVASENTVLYCASSNRVGGLLALRAYWLNGASAEDALALGREAGLRGLEPAVAALLAEPR
jgi:protein tyrosine phosphatase (PTP) superfamily phosphohydrolase (DUF442 family)